MENGDAVRFSTSGVLLDGQHRLEALHASRSAAWLLVAVAAVGGLVPALVAAISGFLFVTCLVAGLPVGAMDPSEDETVVDPEWAGARLPGLYKV